LVLRHGEKAHEVLVTSEEMSKAEDMGEFFRIPMDNRDMNYGKFYPEGSGEVIEYTPYSSDVTERLDGAGVMKLLKKMGEVEV
jgi:UDP-N-acetylglucosamine 4,6-dehydratase